MRDECTEIGVEKLYAYAANELDAAAYEELAAHLVDCARCRDESELVRRVLADLSAVGDLKPVGVDRHRIRARVLSRISERRREGPRWAIRIGFGVAGAAAAAAASFALMVLFAEDPGVAPADEIRTAAIETRAGEPAAAPGVTRAPHRALPAATPVLPPAELKAGERVAVAAGAPARAVSLGERTGLLLQPGSEVLARSTGPGVTRLELLTGSALFKVALRGAGEVFAVQTEEAEVRVVGTVFMVSRPVGEGTLVRVAEGRVEVRPREPGAKPVVLEGGQEISVRPVHAEEPLQPVVQRDPALEAFAAGALFGARMVEASEAAAAEPAEIASSPKARIVEKRRPRSRRGRRVAARGRDLPIAARQALPQEDFSRLVTEARTLARRGEHFRAAELLADAVDRAPGRGLEAEARYLLARSYSVLGSYSRALREYEVVIDQGLQGPLEQRALYEAGLLHGEQLHTPRAAIRLWERYLARYSSGLFDEEVNYLLCETRARIGEGDAALTSCKDYLDRFPRGYRSTEALLLAATLYREHRRDHGRALDYYEKYLKRANARRPDEALYWKAGCLLQRRDKARAAEALRRYLERFPKGKRRGEARRLLDEIGAR